MSQTSPPQNSRTIGTLLKTPFEGINRFILSDLRDGRLSLQGLPYSTVVVIIFGFIILFSGVALTFFFPILREQFNLITLQDTARLLRGSSIAEPTAPIALFLLSVGWGFLLAGTIRVNRWLRYLILFVYFGSSLTTFLSAASSLALNINTAVVAILLLALLSFVVTPIFMLIRRRRQPRFAFEFCTLFVLAFLVHQLYQVGHFVDFGPPHKTAVSLQIEAYFSIYIFIVLPFFVQLGLEIGKFVRKLSFWTGEIFYFRFKRNRAAIYIALAIFIVLQTIAVGRSTIEYFQQNATSNPFFDYIGATSILLIVWGLWWLLKRFDSENQLIFTHDDKIDEALEPIALPASILMIFFGVLSALTLLILPFFAFVQIWFEQESAIFDRLSAFIDWSIEGTMTQIFIIAVVTLFWGGWLVWRKQTLAGYFIFLFGQSFLWANLFKPGRLFENFGWTSDVPVDFWWSMFLLVLTIVWLLKKELTPQRAISLLILTLINTIIFRQTDFAEDPIFGLFQISGTGIIAFGIIWDAVTVGDWANDDTPNLPRESRIYLYLGYVIIALCTIIWAIGQHDHTMINLFTGDGAIAGLRRLGQPMLYMLYPLLLTLPKDHLPLTDSND